MPFILGFYMFIALFSGFMPVKETPKNQVNVSTMGNVVLRENIQPYSKFTDLYVMKQNFDYSCGSAALATLLNYYLGEDFTEKQVINGLISYGNIHKIKRTRAFSLLDMKRFSNVLGYKAAGFRANIQELETLKEPAIVPINIMGYKHFTVFKGICADRVFLADPWRGNSTYTISEFENIWYDNVLFIVSPKNKDGLPHLMLSDNDLKFIDDNTALIILLGDTAEPINHTRAKFINNVPNTGLFNYKPR